MAKLPPFSTRFYRPSFILLATTLSFLIAGCASFNSHMSAAPQRSGPPPYADDPEANGNPAKAWYN